MFSLLIQDRPHNFAVRLHLFGVFHQLSCSYNSGSSLGSRSKQKLQTFQQLQLSGWDLLVFYGSSTSGAEVVPSISMTSGPNKNHIRSRVLVRLIF